MTPPAAAAAPAAKTRLARPPRRVSGPARSPAARQPGPRIAGTSAWALELLAALERLSRHRLLDRLIRGRTWIGLLAFALIGIVTLQLALLKLNGGIGRALEHEARLQRENAVLSIENSELAASDHVRARASQIGMESAPVAALRFLTAHPGSDIARGAAALGAPSRRSAQGSEEAPSGSRAGSSTSEASASEASASSSTAASESMQTRAGGSQQAGTSAGESAAGAREAAPAAASPEASGTGPAPAGASGGPSATEASPSGGTQASPRG